MPTEKQQRELKLIELRKAISLGDADIADGRVSPMTWESLQEIKEEVMAELAYEALCRDIDAGRASCEAGFGRPLTDELIEEIIQRGESSAGSRG